MTTSTPARVRGQGRPIASPRAAGRAVTSVAAREIRRGALTVAALSAGMSALVAVQYQATFSDALAVASLEALAANPAISTLFGPARGLDDPGGFTVWRTGAVIAVMVATWTFLAATRITRGEEDAGRWTLLLAGAITTRQAVARHLAVVLATDLLITVLLASALIASGTSPTGAILYGTGIGLVGAVFAGLGLLAAQLLPDRRIAAGACAAILVAGLLIRMVADGVTALGWLRWTSAFGLLAEIRPFAGDRLTPIPVLAIAAAALAAAAVAAAGRRDVGDALLQLPDTHRPRTTLLTSLSRFLVRRTVRAWAAWAAGLGAYFLLIGLLAQSLSQFLTDNPRFAEMAAQAGFAEMGTVEGYAAALFSLLAVPVGLFATSRVAADAGDEEDGRLTLVFSAPIARSRWVATQTGLLLAACVALCAAAGAATWAGAQWVGAPLSVTEALTGALNAVPVAALSLGMSILALGWAPRAIFALGAVPVVGGFILLTLADTLSWPEVIRDLSPFAHLAAVPARAPNVVGSVVMLSLAAALAAIGTVGYARRDVRG